MDSSDDWQIEAGGGQSEDQSPESVRPIGVRGLWGYVDPWGVEAGERLSIHLTAPAAHEISVRRLGRSAVLDPTATDSDERAESLNLATVERAAACPCPVRPGSYALVPGPLGISRPGGISLWLRLWRLPSVDEVWNWAGLVTQFDFPDACGFAFAVDFLGRPAVFAGGPYSHGSWRFAEARLDQRLGEWVHLAVSFDPDSTRIYLDGLCVYEGSAAERANAVPAPLRLGAAGEQGVADHLIDADLSSVILTRTPISRRVLRQLADDPGLSSPADLGISDVQAFWPLRQTAGDRLVDSSDCGRDGRLVGSPTLGVPGPAAGVGAGRRDYDPTQDPLRGGAVRFASDDLIDARWPAAARVTVPSDAESGLYSVRVRLAGTDVADSLEIPFVVVRPRPRRAGSVAVLAATFTWTAYGRRPANDEVTPGLASSFYSQHLSGKPFFQLGMRLPLPRARPYRPASHRLAETEHQHLVRPERLAEAWLSREGYAFEFISDRELHSNPGLLHDFAALMIVGHSEYWTQEMRDGVEAYLETNGNVLSLSGNTLFWRVTFDAKAAALECRKTSHADEQDQWLAPEEWGERWHTDGKPGGAWSLIGQPTSQLLGLETLGWIDTADRASFAPFRVVAADHPLFNEPEKVPLTRDGFVGARSLNGAGASGYEMDGLPEAVGMIPSQKQGRTLLAHAHDQHYVERFTEDPVYGADVIYWERPGGGRVFNAGSIGFTGSLAVDPGLQALTRNVLHRFGVRRGPS